MTLILTTFFVEIFLMPQSLRNNNNEVVGHNILIKNVSSYPIYLNSYSLNGVKIDIGATPIPNDSNSWYGIPITKEIETGGKFSITVNFEDYLGTKYISEGFGRLEGVGWNVHQTKRQPAFYVQN